MDQFKVEYDPETRTFKLVDMDSRTLLEGDALYDLAIPLAFEEVDADGLVPVGSC